MSVRRKRLATITRYPASANTPVIITLPTSTAEYAIIAVDSSDAAIAWSLGYGSGENVPRLPFAAGLSWTEDDLCLDAPHVLNVVASAAGQIVVAAWGA